MTAKQKYLFETAFDQPGSTGNAKPLPTHTDEDVERVREEAFQAGHEAAIVAAREIEERRIKEMFELMAQRIDALVATRLADNEKIALQATGVAVAICRKILPEMARRHALAEIESLIGDCLASMPEEPRIVIRVADRMVDRLQERVTAVAGGFDGKLVLLGDDQMPETDCAAVWADGGTERNLDRLWRDIDDAIARMTGDHAAGVNISVDAPDESPAAPAAAAS